MSIEGVASYADVYSENLTEEDIKDFDDLGVEWRGRNILDIRDDFCIKAIEVYARIYEQKALTDPAELPQLKAEIVQIFEDIFDTESEDEDETSSLLYRFDPISGTYRELIGAEGGFIKSAGKCLKKAGKGIEKGVKKGVKKAKKACKAVVRTIVPPPEVYKEAAKFIEKVEKPIVEAEAKAVEWVKEHPVETAVIVVAVVAVVVTAGAASGAVAGAIDAIAGSAETVVGTVGTAAGASAAALAANSGSNDDRKKDSNKNDKSSSPPSPPPSQNTPSSVRSGTTTIPSHTSYTQPQSIYPGLSTPAQPFVPPNPYIPYSQGTSIPHQFDISPPISQMTGSDFTSITPKASSNDIPRFSASPKMSSDSAIANPNVPQPVNPNFKPPQKENFIEKAMGTAKYIIAKETHEAREVLGDLRVGAAALGNEVVDILNPILPTDIALPKKNLADIQNDTFIAHQHLDEFFEIPLSNKYDPDHIPLIEKREPVTGTIPLPGISVLGNAGKAGKIANAVKTAGALGEGVIAEEAALTGRQIVTLEKGGTSLQKTVGNTFETAVGEKIALESLEKFNRAETYLRPYSGKYLLEVEARELIHQTGIRTFPRPNGIPENFKVKLSGSGAGIKYIHQDNPHISVRVMPGKPHSPNPYQQKPYVIQMKNGKAIDKLGKSVDKKSPEAHIPLEDFIYRNN